MGRTSRFLIAFLIAVVGSVTAYQPAHANTISFNLNGGAGTTPQPISGVVGNRVALPPQHDLTKAGSIFAGWSTVIDGAAVPDPYPIPATPIILFAKWVPNTNIKVTYDRNNGAGTTPQPSYGAVNTPITLPPQGDLSKPGFTFTGWSPVAVEQGTLYPPNGTYMVPATPIILYAKWSANTQVVSFEKNGNNVSGTAPRIMSGTTGSYINLPYQGDLNKPGHTFLGWNTQPDGFGSQYPVTALYEIRPYSTILYAKWLPNSQTITYIGNSNSTGSSYFTESTVADSIIALPTDYSYNLTRVGYRFEGWNTQPDGYGTTYAAGVANFRVPYGNITLYAKWVPIGGQPIIYYANGAHYGVTPPYATAAAGTSYRLAGNSGSNALGRTDYMFGGWNTEANGSGINYSPGAMVTVPLGGLRLYARWASTNDYDRSISTRTFGSSTPSVLIDGVRSSPTINTSFNQARTTKTVELSTYNGIRIGLTLPNTTMFDSTSRFTVYGSGFSVNSRVDVYVLSTLVANVTVDYSGSFTYDGFLPGNLASGTHSIRVNGTGWGYKTISSSFPLSVRVPSTTNKSTIYFGYGSSSLSIAAKKVLKRLVSSKISGKSVNSITISGFSRAQDEDFAWDRADVTADYLWQLGVEVPITTNTKVTNAGNQQGRRVEIVIK